MKLPKITFWRVVAAIIIVAGVYSTYIRFTQGLQFATNLSDQFPWGLWIGFDILCGVGLAAGGFTICAVTHIFNIESFKPLTRPAILTAFLGYIMVIFGLLIDLGKPYNIWHAIIMWNTNSVMFEVAWCVMLYSTVLFLEFSPVILERFKLDGLLKFMKKISTPIFILGIVLSTLHQSSLGSLFLIVPTKMNALWYSPMLPVNFFLSAISAGFAMIIFEAYLSARALGHEIKLELLSKIGYIAAFVLLFNLLFKVSDLLLRGQMSILFVNSQALWLFYLELFMGLVVPAGILLQKSLRENRTWLYISSCLIVAGFIMNRLNVSITAISSTTGHYYFPSFGEVSITMMLVVIGMYAFGFITKNFPVFTEEHKKLSVKH